jgi:hypothetical protein
VSTATVADQPAPVTEDTEDARAAPVVLDTETLERLARDAFNRFQELDRVWTYKREESHNAAIARDDALRTFNGLAIALDTLIRESQDDPPFTMAELEHAASDDDGDMPFRKLWRMACAR